MGSIKHHLNLPLKAPSSIQIPKSGNRSLDHGKSIFIFGDNQLDNLFLSTSQQTEAFFMKFGAIRIDYIENGWDEGLHR